MIAGFVKLHLKQDRIEDAVRYWNATVAEAKVTDLVFRSKLRGSFLMIDRKTGHGYSVGLWESAEDSEHFETTELFSRMVAALGSFCVKPPVREQFQVEGGDVTAFLTTRRAA
jgi:hypothetical protein